MDGMSNPGCSKLCWEDRKKGWRWRGEEHGSGWKAGHGEHDPASGHGRLGPPSQIRLLS